MPARPKARRDRLETLARSDAVVVLYESPHRIVETVEDLSAALDPGRIVVIGRELTKRFEQIHRGTAGELPGWLLGDPDRQRGEFVIAFDAAPPEAAGADAADTLLRALCDEALPVRQAARIAAKLTGLRANDLYRRALGLRGLGRDEAAEDGEAEDGEAEADPADGGSAVRDAGEMPDAGDTGDAGDAGDAGKA